MKNLKKDKGYYEREEHCEAGEIETIGMLMGVQLRPVSSKKNDNFIFCGKVVPEDYHPTGNESCDEDCEGM